MVSNQHPLAKTCQDVRRAIARMEAYLATNPEDAAENNVPEILLSLRVTRAKIPSKFVDVDLKEVT